MESESLNIVDFKGSQSSPSIVITAALHGNEQTATYVADLLINRLENEKILGNCRIIPVCNETAFKNRQRRAPEDNEDLNRVFPGNLEGTFSENLASKIWEETKDFDYILDLHCCGIFGHLYTMCEYSKSKDQYELCQQLGIKTVIHTAGTGGQFYLEAMRQRGQKSLLIEFPGGQPSGIIDLESAHDVLEKIINYLKIIGVIDGEPIDYGKVNLCGIIDKENIMTNEDGIYKQIVKAGQLVLEGELLAIVGKNLYYSPYDAIITSSPIDRYVFKGDKLVSIAPSKEIK